MHSARTNPTSGLISFPNKSRHRVATAPEARTRNLEIHELCRDTSLALQELRHGVLNVLSSTLEVLDMDTMTLVQVLDERPSIVRELMEGNHHAITTETILRYVEALRPYWQPGIAP
jgi:hypothetical protein